MGATPEQLRLEHLRSLRRSIAEAWPDGPSKALVLSVLDEMLLEADEEAHA